MEQEEIKAAIVDAFSYLTLDHGFEGPVTCQSNRHVVAAYLHREVGIEIEVELLDVVVYAMVVRLEDGRLPDGYYISDGRTCRWYLNDFMKRLGLPMNVERPPSGPDTLSEALAYYAMVVRNSLSEIVGGAERIF